MGKILVTGGAGFIGSNFIYYMLENYKDSQIICLDCLTYAANLANLKDAVLNKNFKFVKGDITDRPFIFKLFKEERFDVVVNFAAQTHVDRSIDNPQEFLTTNILGTSVLLDAFNEYGGRRFHQISTDEVYGDLPLNRPDLMFTEQMQLKTSSPYSASKASADLLALAYYRTYATPVTISRCSNNYGPMHFPEKLIPLIITNAMQDKPLPVYGDGGNIRDWLYVKDHCKAIDMIIENGRAGEIYNVGGNNEKKNIDVVKIVLKTLGKSEDLIEFIKDRPGHDLRYAIDASKIKNELSWEPQVNFEDGIAYTVKWFMNNEKWWRDILSKEYLNNYKRMFS
ncbi:MAG: dTDP-glucose 4,6-dehydratase [Oscillospiraceae bacterium]|jgi:dTDP-glucose 4,6-dehydratase|nr:dTDP-glucose 4,6-dehydratase [Oscillospiraceae bacterium]